jgi:hypothetical protein
MHACPFAQSPVPWQTPHALNSELQPSPGWHSVALVHAQLPRQVPDGPHWVSVVHAPQTPATQTSPMLQSVFATHAAVQMPAAHASPVAQSPLTVQVHWTELCVAVHVAVGPHWLSAVQSPHFPPVHTSPAPHSSFEVHPLLGQPDPVHTAHASYDWQLP